MHPFISVSIITSIILLSGILTDGSTIYRDYMQKREKLISDDNSLRIGGKLVLTPDEKIVSDIFMKEKIRLMEESRLNLTVYTPSISFFLSKPLIDNSTLLRLIKQMPKGAALHLHDISVTSLDWLVKNATYNEYVYMCVRTDNLIDFHVFKSPPSVQTVTGNL
uniref:Adenosine/AMP deaminase N-terminal domain-containing protein n=1 Tax=Arion vulgaris TaxID=1028688 RepID=A0A0B7ATQ8_9EUPU